MLRSGGQPLRSRSCSTLSWMLLHGAVAALLPLLLCDGLAAAAAAAAGPPAARQPAPAAGEALEDEALEGAVQSDDLCVADEDGGSASPSCALSALQLRGRALGDAAHEVTVASEESAASDDIAEFGTNMTYFCKDTCWSEFGFIVGDCACSVHSNWYMWICKTRYGAPIKWEFGSSYRCTGLTKVAPTPAPAPPPVLAPVPAPAPGPECTASWSNDCRQTRKCCTAGYTCYEKSADWAACLPSCQVGIHWSEPAWSLHIPWSCRVLEEPKTYYDPADKSLVKPSDASLLTFYVYRVQDNENYEPMNQNVASLAGAMFYLHNEIVWHTPRRFKKSQVQKFKLKVRAPQPLWNKGMNFGVRVAFDRGMCTGPFSCQKDWDTYGYNVGCNNARQFPTNQFNEDCYYEGAIWYSLPGPCPNMDFHEATELCDQQEPGGACPPGVEPTGEGNCTFTYEYVGNVSINELSGINGSYSDFIDSGGREYIDDDDRGKGTSFWNDKHNTTACAERVAFASNLFNSKYPEELPLPTPECDFEYEKFYAH